MSANVNAVERHGCLVCARVFSALVVYGPGGRLVGGEVTSPGGRRVADAQTMLVACSSHSAESIESAHQGWLSAKNSHPDAQENE